MPQLPCNKKNPHLVVPHLIVRQPLPTGSAPVDMSHITEIHDLLAYERTRIDDLNNWRTTIVDPSLEELRRDVGSAFAGVAPVGSIMMWPTNTPPPKWLLCDGAEYQSEDFPELAAVLSSGAPTFRVPDMRNLFPRGYNNDGELLDTFEDTTRSPRNLAPMETDISTDTEHTHDLANTHSHNVDIFNANATHNHTAQASSKHSHGGNTGNAGDHKHYMAENSQGTPISAFDNHTPGALPQPLPYAGNEQIYDNLDPYQGYTFFATLPNVVLNPRWKTSSPIGNVSHGHSISLDGEHSHTINNSNATHNHTASCNTPVAGDTQPASCQHAHTINNSAGWDNETRPKGILINFIIRC